MSFRAHRRTGLAAIALIAVLGSTGCGAVIARQRIVGAGAELAAAKRAGAEATSPYEYTGAVLYLEKAKEAEAYGRFGPAMTFGAMAGEWARKATLNASAADPVPADEGGR